MLKGCWWSHLLHTATPVINLLANECREIELTCIGGLKKTT